MNLTLLLAGILQPMLFKPLQKGGLWAARQSLGKARGDAAAPLVDALAGASALSLINTATSHLTNDKLAQQIGIPTTEQALVNAAQSVVNGTSTLDLSHQNLLADFLQQSIVRATSASP